MSHHEEKNIEELHRRFLRTLHELGPNSYLGQVYVHRLGQQIGMNSVGFESDREELAEIARDLEEAGYIRRSSPGYFALTDEGKRRIEEEENHR